MKLLVIATAIGVCFSACMMARASEPVACSSFNGRGDAVTATLAEQKLSLQITSASGGKPVSLSALTDEMGLLGCSVFFDGTSRYVAVGVRDLGLKGGPLRIAVADLVTGKLIGNFAMQPDVKKGASLKLAGFLQGNPVLVVFGSGAPDHTSKAFSTTLLRVTGEIIRPPETRTLPENIMSVGNINFADAKHNRLWFKSSPEFCPLRSVSLVGDGPGEVAADDEPNASAACDVVSAVAYPDGDTLITAVTREPRDLVLRIDLTRHGAQQAALPDVGGRGSYTNVGRGVLSPDGQVFAVSRNILSNSPVGDVDSSGTEVDIVQVNPLRVLGKFRLTRDADPASLSVSHRDRTVTVLSFGSGRWNAQQLKTE